MKLVEIVGPNTATVEFSKAELEVLASALNEVCNGLDLWDFAVRMGAEKPEVLKLLHRLHEVLDLMSTR